MDSINSGSNPIAFKADAGKTYTLYTNNLYSNIFTITTNDIVRKEITYLEFYAGNKWYSASIGSGIDTVNNTINIVTEPNTALTHQQFYLNRLDDGLGLTTLKLGDSIISNNGYLNFNSPFKITIIGVDGIKVNYTITVTKRIINSGNDFVSFYLPA